MDIYGLSKAVFTLFSLACALQDIKDRSIHISTYLCFGALGLLYCFTSERNVTNILIAMLPAVCFALTRCFIKDGIGLGDITWMFTAAFYLDIWELIIILMVAFLLSLPVALFLIVKNRSRLRAARDTELPFTAFLLSAQSLFIFFR